MTTAALPASAQQGSGPVSLTGISGRILVNGRPYVGGPLQPGDVVTAVGPATATLSFPDGCQVGVPSASPLTIGPISPCAVGNGQGTPGSNGYVAAAVVVAAGVGIGVVVGTQHRSVSP